MLRKALGSAFVVGALSMSVLAVAPFIGSAIAQVPPPTCAEQMQTCKKTAMDTRNACQPQCANSSDPNCQQSVQDQFVDTIQFCNDRMATCVGDLPPTGSYSASCSDISVSADGTLTAQCKDFHGVLHSAELANAYACDTDIININGTLVCGVLGCAL
jgi:hypothetical protein